MKIKHLKIITDLLVNHILGQWPQIFAHYEDLSYDAPPYGTIPKGDLVWIYEEQEGEEKGSVDLCVGELDYQQAYIKLIEAGVIKNDP